MLETGGPRSTLPLELVLHIIPFVEFSILPALLRTCKAVFPVAAARLYTSLELKQGQPVLPFIDPSCLTPYYRRRLGCSAEWDASPYSKSTSLRTYTKRLEVNPWYEPLPDDVEIPHLGLSGNPLPRLETLAIGYLTLVLDMHYECTGTHLGFYEQLTPTTILVMGDDPEVHLPKCSHEKSVGTRRPVIPPSVTRLALYIDWEKLFTRGSLPTHFVHSLALAAGPLRQDPTVHEIDGDTPRTAPCTPRQLSVLAYLDHAGLNGALADLDSPPSDDGDSTFADTSETRLRLLPIIQDLVSGFGAYSAFNLTIADGSLPSARNIRRCLAAYERYLLLRGPIELEEGGAIRRVQANLSRVQTASFSEVQDDWDIRDYFHQTSKRESAHANPYV